MYLSYQAIEKSSESSPRLSRDTPEKQNSYDNLEDVAGSPTTHEFVSDAFDCLLYTSPSPRDRG